jgi:hypothetical protein
LTPIDNSINYIQQSNLGYIGKFYILSGNGVVRLYTSVVCLKYDNFNYIKTKLG